MTALDAIEKRKIIIFQSFFSLPDHIPLLWIGFNQIRRGVHPALVLFKMHICPEEAILRNAVFHMEIL
jgi:hypothetical protein